MRTSQVVEEWRNEGRAEGRLEGQLETRRDDLLALLENRFGSLPEELIQRIRALKDVQRLNRAFQQALNLQSLEDLHLEKE
jgi:predicted transposase YdaD